MGRPVTETPMQRFVRQVDMPTPCGCWMWEGAIAKTGYGVFWIDGKTDLAHRAAHKLFRSDIPHGLTIDHLCRNRRCVNPGHFEVVTRGENTLRGNSPYSVNARKTHCLRGHEFSGNNVRLATLKSGSIARVCKTCRRQDAKAALDRKRKAG